ncbi:ABC transporter permease subunit [Halobaculum sp. WSA2]|uniref:ABC transporter permease subunit n=1 Tax=Halobaculum saliterrae TaxID=2073113 RepID=A0A6B0SVL0_9EURY|nr:iron ABC transporter permease [Halobaculum saliterrae]MXR40262.1 ABC transporter permease subunit [Halobaculum saliterrae]
MDRRVGAALRRRVSDARPGRLLRRARAAGPAALAERSALPLLAAVTALLLAVLFYYPVATVFVDAVVEDGRVTFGPLVEVLTDEFYLVRVLGFTAYQALLSTLLSVLLGLPGAWVLARFEFRGRDTLRSVTMVPFVVPSVLVAAAFYATFGAKGTLNAALSAVGLPELDLLPSLGAILVAHAFYNAPLVTRVVAAAWESVDAGAVETARSLGASRRRAFRDVVVPQLLPALLTGATLTFVFTFATFAIPLALGGSQYATIEVFIYSARRQLEYGRAASLAALETGVSLSLMALYLRYERAQAAERRGVRTLARRPLWPDSWSRERAARRLAIAGYAVVVAFVFVAPLASMLYASVSVDGRFTLDAYRFLLERQATGATFQVKPFPAIVNSLVFGAAALAVALPLGVAMGVLTTRRFRGRWLVDALSMAPLAVSGIVVGLGLLRGLVFGFEAFGYRFTVTGAVAIVAAHAVGAYPFVVRTVAPPLDRLDRALVESARALGASRARTVLDVELPLVWPGVVAGAAFAFAISIGEFDATVILAEGGGTYTMPVAVERFIGRRLGPATAMGTVLLAVTAASFVVIERVGGEFRG